jgi:predicted dehydrogenase
MRVVVIGSGNVAESLAQAIAETEGLELVQIFARNEVRGRRVAELAKCQRSNDLLAEADLYLISVSDNAVAELA